MLLNVQRFECLEMVQNDLNLWFLLTFGICQCLFLLTSLKFSKVWWHTISSGLFMIVQIAKNTCNFRLPIIWSLKIEQIKCLDSNANFFLLWWFLDHRLQIKAKHFIHFYPIIRYVKFKCYFVQTVKIKLSLYKQIKAEFRRYARSDRLR